jgi:RNA recognition motif-containing protein
LPLDAKQEDLRALFEKYGVITECDVLNRFGFVHMKSEEMAKRAIAALHNSEFMGSRITVEVMFPLLMSSYFIENVD